jgi:hypothetical protein
MAFKLEKTPIVKFNNGIEFPVFGLGTWLVSQLFSAQMCYLVADRRTSRKCKYCAGARCQSMIVQSN